MTIFTLSNGEQSNHEINEDHLKQKFEELVKEFNHLDKVMMNTLEKQIDINNSCLNKDNCPA